MLKPGAEAGVMLYHRRSLLFMVTIAFQEGLVNLERLFLDPLALASRYGDGAREEGNPHTWPVTQREIRSELFRSFRSVDIRRLGSDVAPILSAWRTRSGQHFEPLVVGGVGAAVRLELMDHSAQVTVCPHLLRKGTPLDKDVRLTV